MTIMTPDIRKAAACLRAGDAAQAASFLQDTIDRAPEYAAAHVLLAQAREALGEWDRALHAWREAALLAPTSPVVFRGLARAARKRRPPREPAQPERNVFADMDRLIARLESARIDPHPDAASFPAPDLDDDIDDVVSETLAGIYASQRRNEEAARIYEALAEQRPEQAAAFRDEATRLRSAAAEG